MTESQRAYRDEYDRSVATWLPTGDGGHLALFVDEPTGRVRGVSVIVMPTAREYVCTYRGLRVLADDLRADGQLVIRCALRGEGNSTPLDERLPAETWTADVSRVVEFARTLVDAPVTLIGVRLSAGVVSAVTAPDVGMRILLEPVAGRRFLRQQQALRLLSAMIDVPVTDDLAEIAGRAFTPAQAKSLGTLRLSDDAITVEDPNSETARTFYGVDPEEGTVPRESIHRIRSLVPAHDDVELSSWTPLTSIEQQVADRLVRASWVEVGPHHLPGVITEPATTQAQTGIVFGVSGTEPMDGPTGLWAELSWPLAAAGHLVLRCERWGQGELMVRGRETAPNPYNEESIADTREAIRHVRSRVPGEVVSIGLCAGASLMMRASAGERIDRQLAINDQAWVLNLSFYEHLLNPTKLRQALVKPTTASVRSLKVRQTLRRILRESRNTLAGAMPQAARRRLSLAGIIADPYSTLMDAPAGTSVVLAFGTLDELLWNAANGPAALRRLPADGPDVSVEREADIDHALLSQRARQWTLERALAFAAAPSAPPR